MTLPAFITDSCARAHPSWHPVLEKGIRAVAQADSSYLAGLEKDTFLPTKNRLFAAFSQPMDAVRYVLVGEGPYPREESASGYCFMDGAVRDIWSDKGFSKPVNRATSLRNFLKMLLVAENTLQPGNTSGEAMAAVARAVSSPDSPYIRQLDELQQAMLDQGFLLLNATLVFRKHIAPARESRAWLPFLQTVMDALADNAAASEKPLPVLVLWGKIAEKLTEIESVSRFPQVASEHPYNLSFIRNTDMQHLFGSMGLFRK
ncbi:uracil-DNA glycosylase [Oxalobacter vibrioformis]|uniref:Uracil-DNA glycosylase n=1 Tax=Oxalobacter vibrioformis TaxID=933080 RepID=A0A9E9LYG9_9BURK|nr:uracil-DNA glycosylase [Oxalobacter vibrioformis]WAW09802.1 uracil-DNA glycosylase [Oxalobacter vibrioformis]